MLSIVPGGFLCAVMISKLGAADDLHFEITDEDQIGLYGEFTVPRQLTCGGIMLPEPIPNMNSAYGYWLKLPRKFPKLEIISINQMQDYG